MGKNYYSILHVQRTASDIDLKQAFRRQALIWHPDRNAQDPAEAKAKFDDICEAYAVLINKSDRAVYDLYGEEILKRGVPDGQGGYLDPWVKAQSNEELFVNFFGSNNPFMVDGKLTGQPILLKELPALEPIKSVLHVTYEEVYTGVTRLVTVSRRFYDHESKQSFEQEKTFQVPIHKGTAQGTRIVFEGAGNQCYDQCGNVEIEIQMAPHPIYHREEYDLIVTKELCITEALAGCIARIPTLDKRILSLPITQVVVPGSRIKIPREGLCRPDGQTGDLYVQFQVKYPDKISEQQKQVLKRILPIHKIEPAHA